MFLLLSLLFESLPFSPTLTLSDIRMAESELGAFDAQSLLEAEAEEMVKVEKEESIVAIFSIATVSVYIITRKLSR